MRRPLTRLALVAIIVILSGCATRSISNSGHEAGRERGSGNPFYKGELSEFAVLGIDPNSEITDAQIQDALSNKRRVSILRGSGIMLIQSGALIPDEEMVQNLEQYYKVAVFSGVPEDHMDTPRYSKTLRLAAAQGGYETIMVYWGLLESSRKGLATKSVSWVPVVGWVLPDESQNMRIRLKVAVVDVGTGAWDMFSPEPYVDDALSAILSRKGADQAQVAMLKKKAYVSAAKALVQRYAN